MTWASILFAGWLTLAWLPSGGLALYDNPMPELVVLEHFLTPWQPGERTGEAEVMRKMFVVIVLVLALASCSLFCPNPFIGDWSWVYLSFLSFTDTTVRSWNIFYPEELTGSFTYDEDTLTIRWSGGIVETMAYLFPDNKLYSKYGLVVGEQSCSSPLHFGTDQERAPWHAGANEKPCATLQG